MDKLVLENVYKNYNEVRDLQAAENLQPLE